MTTRRVLAALSAGVIFGFGLALSGMLDPACIRGFLDFAGEFDPSLAFVFAGALAISAAGYAVSRRLARPVFAKAFAVPPGQPIDAPLVVGAAIFGVGWGLTGLCPVPAIAGLTLGLPPIVIFTVSMFAGMAAHDAWRGRRRLGAEDAAPIAG